MLRTAARFLAVALALAFPVAAGAALDPLRLSFDPPSQVSSGPAYQAAEPSIRVDAFSSPTQRIWIAAPSGIGVNTRSLAGPEGGDLFWYSDDDGYSWHFVTGPEGVGSPTMVGGGGPDIDASKLSCQIGPDYYQWPGNVAVDETSGAAYVTYTTQGDPDNDDII